MEITIRKLEKEDYASINDLVVSELGYINSTREVLCKRLELIQSHPDFYTLRSACLLCEERIHQERVPIREKSITDILFLLRF